MKYLVDTCGWIEYFIEGSLAEEFSPYFDDLSQLVIPTVLQYELYRWVCREKDEAMAVEVIGLTEQGHIVHLDTSLALLAAEVGARYRLAAMDAMIYSITQHYDVELITSDGHFKDLPKVSYFSKRSQ